MTLKPSLLQDEVSALKDWNLIMKCVYGVL